MCGTNITKYGNAPTTIMWDVVRGDTASIKIDFLEADESTAWDTTGWTYIATAYDKFGDVLDMLDISFDSTSVVVTAPASVTENWGRRYGAVVGNVIFDLQVTIPQEGEDYIWTPIVGNITVIGDVTRGCGL